MSRLIDTDALIEDLKKWKGLDNKTIEAVIETINNQPTAFDTEKVVEQLETLHDLVKINQKLAVSQAIYIVKKGGVE